MIAFGEHKVLVYPSYHDGVFKCFKVLSKKKLPDNDVSYNNIQTVENLTYEDFTTLGNMIAQIVTIFLDMKQREKGSIRAMEEEKESMRDLEEV